jgi:hypothetical protein
MVALQRWLVGVAFPEFASYVFLSKVCQRDIFVYTLRHNCNNSCIIFMLKK